MRRNRNYEKFNTFLGVASLFEALFLIIIFIIKNDITRGIMYSLSFIFIAIILLPIFNTICRITDKDFSVGRKIILAIGTYLIGPLLFIGTNLPLSSIFHYLIEVLIFWIIMFASDKKCYINTRSEKILKESEKKDAFHQIYNSIIRKRNARILTNLKIEEEIKKNLFNMNLVNLAVISKMIGETKEKYNAVASYGIPEINMSDIILAFCKDMLNVKNEEELNNLYSPKYYLDKIDRYCSKTKYYIINNVKNLLLPQYKNDYTNLYDRYISNYLEAIDEFVDSKYYGTIFNSNFISNINKTVSKLEIDDRINGCFYYVIDTLATCTCISKIMFVQKRTMKLSENDEFYKIIFNMSKEINDIDTVVNKSKPIYDEFYKSSLGFIDDKLLYRIAIINLINRFKDTELQSSEVVGKNAENKRFKNISDFDNYIKDRISVLSKENKNLDIKNYILLVIINTIEYDNFDLLINALGLVDNYSKLYFDTVEHNNKEFDKERYLIGDFQKEKLELSGKFTLNNITNGTQFELYLTNLFKELGYKTKHNGKAGDQGADLILKKGDYVYVVQAKYYTSKLGNTPVQEIVGALKFYNANQGVVITNSEFTLGAENLAKANNVILIDGKDLKKLTNYIFKDDHNEDVLKNFEK